MSQKKVTLCLITHPFSSDVVGSTLVSKFVSVLRPSVDHLFVITGISEFKEYLTEKDIEVITIKCSKTPILISSIKYIYVNLYVCAFLILNAKKYDGVIFFLTPGSIVQNILLCLLKKKYILVVTGSSSQTAKQRKSLYSLFSGFVAGYFKCTERINYALVDSIVVYSDHMTDDLELCRFKSKMSVVPRHYIDFQSFRRTKPFEERDNIIGYIGRLSEEKGVLNFVAAVQLLFEKNMDSNLKILIGGNGPLFPAIEHMLIGSYVNKNVTLVGWISHDELPSYLNMLKLLVLPSYTEGLPNIVIEAMSCGTPVLATPVGGVPDLIEDGVTGFILENNSPETILDGIRHALDSPSIAEVSKNAEALVNGVYSYEKAVQRYREFIDQLYR